MGLKRRPGSDAASDGGISMGQWRSFPGGVFFGELYEPLFGRHLNEGLSHLVAVTGYASGAFVRQLLMENPNLRIEMVIGMAGISGITESDHRLYRQIAQLTPDRFECYYYPRPQGAHAKAYVWLRDRETVHGYVGSPNLSWSGLLEYLEVAAEVNPHTVLAIFNQLKKRAVEATSPDVLDHIRIIPPRRQFAPAIAATHGAVQVPVPEALPGVVLSLLTRSGKVHERAGLNWGQREGRNRDQAYIPVPAIVHREHPGFFPPRERRFLVETDDGVTLVCVIAQDNDKAIETPDNNSLLGGYFRRRMGLQSGAKIALQDLEAYGRTDVEFTKIDQDLFLMNFSPS